MAEDVTGALEEMCGRLRGAHPQVFAGYGAAADRDEAFDLASTEAGNLHGIGGLHPSLAVADPDAVLVAGEAVPFGVALLAAGDQLATAAPGQVLAWPVAAPAGFVHRRVRVVLTGTASPIPALGVAAPLGAQLRQDVLAALAEAEVPIGEGEVLEQVQVVRARARYKPRVQVNRGTSAASFALTDPVTGLLVEEGFPTAGAARRAAVLRAKEGPLTTAGEDPDTGVLHVVKLAARAEGLPLIEVARSRVAASVTVKVTIASPKPAARTKVVGWVFAGSDPSAPEPPAPVSE